MTTGLLEGRQPQRAEADARQALASNPSSTPLVNEAIRCSYEAGNRAGALQIFADHVRALERLRLGEPDRTTLKIMRGSGDRNGSRSFTDDAASLP